MPPKKLITHITKWIKSYADHAGINTLVIGVSGGIDSAVVSALSANTGLKTIVVTMPIRQKENLHQLSLDQVAWLLENYPDNVTHINLDLTNVFDTFTRCVSLFGDSKLAFANSRSRLRMMTLYQIAQSNGGIVVGTGNKVEDFGVGFFTKYGDGGVDISPIGDCMKTKVWSMGKELGILEDIINAPPTDGLWDDDRTDEDQLGMTYQELELAMNQIDGTIPRWDEQHDTNIARYLEIRNRNLHKMNPIPVCPFPIDNS